jgi:hypothetical protein
MTYGVSKSQKTSQPTLLKVTGNKFIRKMEKYLGEEHIMWVKFSTIFCSFMVVNLIQAKSMIFGHLIWKICVGFS